MSRSATKLRLTATPEPTLRIGKAERAQAEILDAAFEFLWSRAFREMTVSSLMATTALSRSVFYRYFSDVHALMEQLLTRLETEILEGVSAWITGVGDPVALLYESLTAEVRICYLHGPFLKAVSDAAGMDENVEMAWRKFLGSFDDAVSERIALDQDLGLIEEFDPVPVATALNRLDASTFIEAFGQRPRNRPEPLLDANARIWISTLYGTQWAATKSSTLIRPNAVDQGAR